MKEDTGQTRGSAAADVFQVNAFAASAGLHPSASEYFVRRGRSLQARAVAQALSTLARRVRRGARRIAGALAREPDRRRTAALRNLDRRLLLDIGVDPAQIPALVDGLLSRREAAKRPVQAVPAPRAADTGPRGLPVAPPPAPRRIAA